MLRIAILFIVAGLIFSALLAFEITDSQRTIRPYTGGPLPVVRSIKPASASPKPFIVFDSTRPATAKPRSYANRNSNS